MTPPGAHDSDGPYTVHTRYGSHQMMTRDLDTVIAIANEVAVERGLCVLICDAVGNDLVFIAPALQTDDIPAILFGGSTVRPGVVALN
jgi:hypothetical protein